MERFRFPGGRLFDGLRALKLWRRSKKKPGRKVDRRTHWDIPLIKPGESVSQQQLSERADRLRGAADEAARLAQTSYVSFLLLGTYIAIIIWSTTDVQLLKQSPVTLPLLNVPLPIVGFYAVVPWLLLLVYFNLLLHLTFLAQKLRTFDAVLAIFTDEAAREEQRLRLFPFPFSVMLVGRPARGRLRWLLGLMVLTTVVLLPLLLLLWAQARFLPYHDASITWNHRIAVGVDLLLLWLFGSLMLIPEPLGGSAAPDFPLWQEEQRQRVARRVRRRRWCWGLGLCCVTLGTLGTAVFTLFIAVLPEADTEVWIASHVPTSWLSSEPGRASKPVFILTYWLFEAPSSPFNRNLRLQDQVLVAGEPSAEVIAALRSWDEHEWAQGLKKITGLPLTNRDLRGANLRDTLFAKADLRGANLKGANLARARVFAGDVKPFQLSGGEYCVDAAQLFWGEDQAFCRTNLQGAYLKWAQLQGAYLVSAQLQGAHLEGAQLQGAHLEHAQLQGAHLFRAQLQGASLMEAQLQGADLEEAQLQGTVLVSAQLQGTYWGHAQLQGASLMEAQLQGADLRSTQIGGADFTGADLTLSNLENLSLLPLDEETYKKLEELLTYTIHDERVRAPVLQRLKAIIGQPGQLKLARAKQALCDDVILLPSCLTHKHITDYVQARTAFLGMLGCKNTVIARGIAWQLRVDRGDSMQMAFAKHFITIPEKDCPGWAALSALNKERLLNPHIPPYLFQ